MDERTPKQALPARYRRQNYRIERVLGVGGVGVTYVASHATLGHRVAIKEYLPSEFAVRDGTTVHAKSASDGEDLEWSLARFLDEAKTLARFEHRNVVRVRDYFEANHTAYIVMDYEDGEPLDRLLDRHGTLTEAQLKRVLLPVVDGLREVHGAGFLHRDIKPSDVFVRREDESPVLLDFGAARQEVPQPDGGGVCRLLAPGAVRERGGTGRLDGNLRALGAVLPGDPGRVAGGGAAAAEPDGAGVRWIRLRSARASTTNERDPVWRCTGLQRLRGEATTSGTPHRLL